MNIPGAVYDSSVPGLAGQPCQAWIKPIDYWTNDSGKNGELYLYESFLRETERNFIYGTTFPRTG